MHIVTKYVYSILKKRCSSKHSIHNNLVKNVSRKFRKIFSFQHWWC